MIKETKDLAARQKFQLKQAFIIGDMGKVNDLIKGKGFSKAFKMQGKRALNLATTFNTPDFGFDRFKSFGNDMGRQLKNMTKLNGKAKDMLTIQNLQNKKFEADRLINDLKRKAQDLGI